MNNYLNNNIVLINMYENLYANGIRIDEIIQMFKRENLLNIAGLILGDLEYLLMDVCYC